MIIAVDFDGTLCENRYPEIGKENKDVIHYLILMKKLDSKLILWTCRVGERLKEAVSWCEERGLTFDAVNENLPEIIGAFGGDTRKIYADLYLDDRNFLQSYNYGKMLFLSALEKENQNLAWKLAQKEWKEGMNL